MLGNAPVVPSRYVKMNRDLMMAVALVALCLYPCDTLGQPLSSLIDL